MRYHPAIDQSSIFRQIASNVVNPLEIIREAISNSHDANAKIIHIKLYPNGNGVGVVEVIDDGAGMQMDDMHRFFDLGRSQKRPALIGEKGLGTKTYYLASRRF